MISSLPGSCEPPLVGCHSHGEPKPVPPATTPPIAMSEDSSSFEVFLADQLRRLEEVLTTQHKQELASVREQAPSSQDEKNIWHACPERKPLFCFKHAPRGQLIPSVALTESVFELAYAPSAVTSVGGLPIAIPSRSKESTPPKRLWTNMSLGLHSDFEHHGNPGTIGSIESAPCSQPSGWLHTPGEIRAGDEMKDEGWPFNYLRPLVTHPLTMRRLVYDLLTMFLVCYDLVVIPLELSELVNANTFLEIIVACFWTIDLFFNFFRGFEEYGVVELRVWKTALAYLKSWFILDFGLVLLDCIILLLTTQVAFAGVLRSTKSLRLWRAFRLLKFLRFYRIPKLYFLSIHMFRSEFSQTMLRISAWIAGILMLNHVTACFWYLLGSSYSSGPTWIQTAKLDYMLSGNSEEPPTSAYLYLTALHWSVVQYTPASMEVAPRNSGERIYNIFTIFSSLVLFPTFLSSITNNMAAIRKANAEYAEARRNLIRFLQDNRISMNLSVRIQSVVSVQYENMKKSQRAHEPNVSLLNLLPRSLKEQMHTEVYQPIISTHPFLDNLADCHERAVIRICDVAMCQESLQSGQELFAYGKEAEKVHFIVSGCLFYFEGPTPSSDSKEEVNSGDFLCDQVLWMSWVHRGQATALQPCELANLDGASFRMVVAQRPAVHSFCCRFAEQYLAHVQEEAREDPFNDLGCSMAMLENIARSTAMGPSTTSNNRGLRRDSSCSSLSS